jgi:hypothetical protein
MSIPVFHDERRPCTRPWHQVSQNYPGCRGPCGSRAPTTPFTPAGPEPPRDRPGPEQV